jgi:hypothetical protein
MAVHGGPDIVEDGLIFAVGAGNEQSYVSGSTTCTSLIGNITGSLVNGVGFSSANQGSWQFDGSDDYIDCGDITAFNGATEMSCFCWIKINTLAIDKGIMVKWDYATQGCIGIQTAAASDELKVFVASAINESGTNHVSTTDANLVAGTWYYVGFVYDGSESVSIDRVKIYVDGVGKTLGASGTIATSLTTATSTFKMGKWGGSLLRYAATNTTSTYIHNRALSPSEVLQNYNATKNRFI